MDRKTAIVYWVDGKPGRKAQRIREHRRRDKRAMRAHFLTHQKGGTKTP